MGKIKELNKEEFRKMQLLQLDMLVELDRICRANNIKYTIFGGTLLGAIRHKGYIPWDDDADIAMLREEYDKFKKVSQQLDYNICYFQDNDTDSEYRWGYGKLRRTNTTYIRVGQEHIKCKNGVFIDVFPMDDIPISTIGQILNDIYCCCLRKILWSEVGKYDSKNNYFKNQFFKILSKIPVDKIFEKQRKLAFRSKNSSQNRVRTLLFPATGKLYKKNSLKTRFGMPKEWFTDLVEYEFEGKKLYGTRNYDENLKYIYGNYMKLPPENNREPHAPVSEYKF
ncbi:LicD family protein [Clostridium botulinum]|nr:LicD family protein [Clostridium botulinum]NFG58744.1 LicD family protein [Clostridium botulinum]NFL58268.1 LicD family protein [Clostridium botulinum]NFL62950.1 LicD family protein [Clostridium botulinum]NFO67963.1 LicD family protein [Clostridium botulinum]